MKVTDYALRAAPFDSHLKGNDLVGVEVGVDVGAHAEALLTYCPISMLHLVDPWPNPYCRGYCEGRLARFRGRYKLWQMGSLDFPEIEAKSAFDFVYLDQKHDGPAVAADLRKWWPRIKSGGVLGHRNYAQGRGEPLDKAIEDFVAANRITMRYEEYLNDAVLFKA